MSNAVILAVGLLMLTVPEKAVMSSDAVSVARQLDAQVHLSLGQTLGFY